MYKLGCFASKCQVLHAEDSSSQLNRSLHHPLSWAHRRSSSGPRCVCSRRGSAAASSPAIASFSATSCSGDKRQEAPARRRQGSTNHMEGQHAKHKPAVPATLHPSSSFRTPTPTQQHSAHRQRIRLLHKVAAAATQRNVAPGARQAAQQRPPFLGRRAGALMAGGSGCSV